MPRVGENETLAAWISGGFRAAVHPDSDDFHRDAPREDHDPADDEARGEGRGKDVVVRVAVGIVDDRENEPRDGCRPANHRQGDPAVDQPGASDFPGRDVRVARDPKVERGVGELRLPGDALSPPCARGEAHAVSGVGAGDVVARDADPRLSDELCVRASCARQRRHDRERRGHEGRRSPGRCWLWCAPLRPGDIMPAEARRCRHRDHPSTVSGSHALSRLLSGHSRDSGRLSGLLFTKP